MKSNENLYANFVRIIQISICDPYTLYVYFLVPLCFGLLNCVMWGFIMDFLKNNLPNLVIPGNCHFLLQFLRMRSHGKVNIDLAYLV